MRRRQRARDGHSSKQASVCHYEVGIGGTGGGRMSLHFSSSTHSCRTTQEDVPAGRGATFRLVTICPTQTLGPLLQAKVNTSTAPVLSYLRGEVESIPAKGKCFVDVRDVAAAHIRALMDERSEGRYLLCAQSIPWRVFANVLRATLPGARVPTREDEGPPSYPQVRTRFTTAQLVFTASASSTFLLARSPCFATQALWSTLRTFSLGIVYTPVEISIRDTALSFYAKGMLDDVIAPSEADSASAPAS